MHKAYLQALEAIAYSLKYHIANKNVDVANKTVDLLMAAIRESHKDNVND